MSNETPLVIGARYRHYKGKFYRVLGMVKHSETLEDLVYYETLYENSLGTLWVRPKDLFLGDVEIDGKKQPRFSLAIDCE
jgi:hypothetical protein